MDYDVVKTSAIEAYKSFRVNDTRFYNAMDKFYEEGIKNPSVARIILQDHIKKGKLAARDMLEKLAAINYTTNPILYGEGAARLQILYSLSTNTALKSIEAEDIYKNTESVQNESMRKAFDKKWADLYPKTGDMRKKIIEADRLSVDNVTHKAHWFNKINFVKTLGEYQKDYPKSFYARYCLIMNNQIKEGEITSRVKGWFKRFSYKRLIKNSFCFKG